MALQFIKNQQCQFEDDTDDTNITFEQTYNPLVQSADRVYFQCKQTACGADELCDLTALGGNRILNGSFTGAATSWNLTGGCAYGTNNAAFTAANNTAAWQSLTSALTGELYKVTFTITRSAGVLTASLGNLDFSPVGCTAVGPLNAYTASGTYTIYLRWVTTANCILFESDDNFVGTLDTVSVNQMGTCTLYPNDGNTPGWFNDGTSIFHVVGATTAFSITPAPLAVSTYYKVTLSVTNMTAGTLVVGMGDSTNSITGNGSYTLYGSSGGTQTFTLTPTTDFDGYIGNDMEVVEMSRSHTIKLINDAGLPVSQNYDSTTSQDPIVYNDEWITWSVELNSVLNLSGIDTPLPVGCYRIVITDACTSTVYTQLNQYRYAGSSGTWANTKLLTAYCDGEAFGFEFTTSGFRLQQRLRMTYFSPKYAIKGDDYFYSTGEMKKLYAERQKLRTALFDYVDENTHDMISLQLNCDTLTVDGVAYFVPTKDYTPEWESNGRRSLAQSRIELQYKTDVLFNKNC